MAGMKVFEFLKNIEVSATGGFAIHIMLCTLFVTGYGIIGLLHLPKGVVMKKYAVGVAPFDGEIKVEVVTAENKIKAMIKAVEKQNFDLVKDKLPDFSSEEEAVQYYFDGDILVSLPVQID